MTDKISKELLGRMLSKKSTEQVIEDIAVEFYKWARFPDSNGKDIVRQGILLNIDWHQELFIYWINNVFKSKENENNM